jgi:PAS domain-containing protein
LHCRATRLIGHSIWELFPDALGSNLEVKLRQALAENSPQEFENYYPPWNRWYYNKVYPTNEGGLAIYWRDITVQKRIQADLHRQALVLEQVHDSIITTDLEGNITQWNHGSAEMFGYTAEEVIGRHVSLTLFRRRPRPGRFYDPGTAFA